MQPKKNNGLWHILRLDKVLNSKFNTNLKLKLALELGDKFLNDKFLEIQTRKTIVYFFNLLWLIK